MKLGSFEELVLLAVGALKDDAYGVTIKEALEKNTGNKPSIGALHSALYRLEEKGYVSSSEGGATTERGGRRKKYYLLTGTGQKMLVEANEQRMEFAKQIPGFSLKPE
ncbi:MAG: helix-turn-helix transcriptional regulator [Cyclobacteriaceae bacterium]